MDMSKKRKEVFETDAFNMMRNLRIIKLGYSQLSGPFEIFPQKIRWLFWRGFDLKYLPNGFPLDHVAAIDMRHSNLEHFSIQNKVLKSLKILNLSHSCHLRKTPDFSTTPNLEKLILKDCQSLIEINDSIANLRRLIFLNLRDCRNLKNLPRNICLVKSLEELVISGCSNLVGAGDELGKMDSLIVLRADRLSINRALSASTDTAPWYAGISPASWLAKLEVNLETTRASLPSSLVTLTLVASNLSDDAFPNDMGSLPSLQNLYLGGNPIFSLPNFIQNLAKLKKLDLSWCPNLQQIQWPHLVIDELVVTECRSLEKITYEAWEGPKNISHGACVNLDYVQSGFKIELVRNINVQVLNNIGFFNLKSKENVETMIVNTIVWSRKTCPIQVLYENGIFNTYFPGREVPRQFINNVIGSKIVLNVPSFSSHKIRGMTMFLVYKLPEGGVDWLPIPISVKIFNMSKKVERTYTPRCYGIPEEEDGDMVWLSHWLWMLWGYLFDEGDRVEISFSLNVGGEIKECGIQFLYYQDEDDKVNHYQNLSSLWDQWMDIFFILHRRGYLENGDGNRQEENEEENQLEEEGNDE